MAFINVPRTRSRTRTVNPEENTPVVNQTLEPPRKSNKGKYNEKFHEGLYRFQDQGKNPSKETFGLSFKKLVSNPMIIVPTSSKEANELTKNGKYKKFRTFEAGNQVSSEHLKSTLGGKKSSRRSNQRHGHWEDSSDS